MSVDNKLKNKEILEQTFWLFVFFYSAIQLLTLIFFEPLQNSKIFDLQIYLFM